MTITKLRDLRDFKFEDCVACSNRGNPDVCAACDAGEMFEPEPGPELDFDSDTPLDDFGDFE